MDVIAPERVGLGAGDGMTRRFAVLMYHRLESPLCPVLDAEEMAWSIPVTDFEMQMNRMRALGLVGVSMDQIHRRLEAGDTIPRAWVGITFDDGNTSDYQHAVPILAQHGFRGTFFICGARVDTELPRETIRAMHRAGMHIGSHAMEHRFMTTLDAAAEKAELVRSRELLEGITGEPVVHFAPPGGRWSSRTARALRDAGYQAVSTSRYGLNHYGRTRFSYSRLPVVRATPPGEFDAMIKAERFGLLHGYARARLIGCARSLMGETFYGRVRSFGQGGEA